MKYEVAGIAVAIWLVTPSAFAQSSELVRSAAEGVVFTVDASGADRAKSASTVSLAGRVHVEAQDDSEGKFSFNAVPPGSSALTAQAPVLVANRTIKVTARLFQK